MPDPKTILAENQKEILKLKDPAVKKSVTVQKLENSDSEPENVLSNTTSTPIKTKATTSETSRLKVNSRNMVTGVLKDSTNQPKTKTTFTKRTLQ